MDRAFKAWVCEQEFQGHDAADDVVKDLSTGYTTYGCMLLLPQRLIDNVERHSSQKRLNETAATRLYELLARHLKVTHIAITRSIPAISEDTVTANVLRAPTNFKPLYGDFGPATHHSPPTQKDFDAAFWVTAKQNGIYQTWAPRWTMFSRGNINEKARLLTLPSVLESVEQGKVDGKDCTAVDLYAGIGYFVFSYLKAGVSKVLCWDINSWSTEGLIRGAAANKWKAVTYSDDSTTTLQEFVAGDARAIIFNESNEHAGKRVEAIRHRLPSIRHINCGMLPNTGRSRRIAFDLIDTELGGWIHHHENFAIAEVAEKAEEVRRVFQAMLEVTHSGSLVELVDVNRVKTYAPGVMHCVVDIYVPPHPPR